MFYLKGRGTERKEEQEGGRKTKVRTEGGKKKEGKEGGRKR